ncbi:hypothetical protein LAV84_18315 [Rhizobium sp. VS19-DR104.2]|uniref:hypothetical protein n=1 Tax=unclassified Rhizobium TaxID=2613769 RepID=UPI001CC7788A|nr:MULTISPECIES: hypothetical protein [unclassified Rhizobium]MBZ5761577.1 hypothetical protein [Rhizobium sp. VS19-DR96]MBZ5767525.1 hypothetical protein [Rhizobium sp. VS19-DR129.2]MBZ5775025.1 hypothetical protein [Rhizobium sp. VS19-DRK62.2]MBZ5786008.1 hypothetical protein [Rhizobium sp. VS19-DR121]MBZ5803436.1 hypothetical protein [Rhizobium sp. VS19-DR181]
MRARLAIPQDLRFVFANPAERCVNEIEMADYTFEQAKDVFRKLRKSSSVMAVLEMDTPIGLIAWEHSKAVETPIIGTYFLGTERFFQPTILSARFGKKFMRGLQSELGNLPMVSMCWSTHPQTERWYEIMGYRLAETFGKQRNFVLDPMR